MTSHIFGLCHFIYRPVVLELKISNTQKIIWKGEKNEQKDI